MADFIEKPFDDEAMLAAIRSALAQQVGDDQMQAERQQVLDRIASLSPREREVMEGLVAGKANKAICALLASCATSEQAPAPPPESRFPEGRIVDLTHSFSSGSLPLALSHLSKSAT